MTLSEEPAPPRLGRPRQFDDDDAFIATAKAIRKHGYDHLTMGNIAAELSCSAPALMSRFGSKSGLLRAYLRWGTQLNAENFRAATESHQSPLEALRSRYRASETNMIHEFGNPLDQIHILNFHVAAWTDPELHDLELERRTVYLEDVTRILQTAVEANEIAGCDPLAFARTMVAAISGSALQWVVDPGPDVGERVVNIIDELLKPYLVDATTSD